MRIEQRGRCGRTRGRRAPGRIRGREVRASAGFLATCTTWRQAKCRPAAGSIVRVSRSMISPALSRTRTRVAPCSPAISNVVPPGSTTFSTGGSAASGQPDAHGSRRADAPGHGVATRVHATVSSERSLRQRPDPGPDLDEPRGVRRIERRERVRRSARGNTAAAATVLRPCDVCRLRRPVAGPRTHVVAAALHADLDLVKQAVLRHAPWYSRADTSRWPATRCAERRRRDRWTGGAHRRCHTRASRASPPMPPVTCRPARVEDVHGGVAVVGGAHHVAGDVLIVDRPAHRGARGHHLAAAWTGSASIAEPLPMPRPENGDSIPRSPRSSSCGLRAACRDARRPP